MNHGEGIRQVVGPGRSCTARTVGVSQLVAAYGILIAGLDTIALILLYRADQRCSTNQPATGITTIVLSGDGS